MSYATTATGTFADLGFFTVVARHQGNKVPSWAELEAGLIAIVDNSADLITQHGFFRVDGLAVAADARDCNAIYVAFEKHTHMRAFLDRRVPPPARGITMEYRLDGPLYG